MSFASRMLVTSLVMAPLLAGAQATPPPADSSGTPVAAHRIARGSVLATGDMRPHADSLVGWVARRLIQAGERLRYPAVAPPTLVRAGHPVDVRVARGGVMVAVRGVALGHASLGDTIPVRLGRRYRIRAIVTGPDLLTAITQ